MASAPKELTRLGQPAEFTGPLSSHYAEAATTAAIVPNTAQELRDIYTIVGEFKICSVTNAEMQEGQKTPVPCERPMSAPAPNRVANASARMRNRNGGPSSAASNLRATTTRRRYGNHAAVAWTLFALPI